MKKSKKIALVIIIIALIVALCVVGEKLLSGKLGSKPEAESETSTSQTNTTLTFETSIPTEPETTVFTAVTDPVPDIAHPWESLTNTQKYTQFEHENKTYKTAGIFATTSDENCKKLSDITITGIDDANESHETKAQIYEVPGCNEDFAVAVKFENTDGYYVYYNADFEPKTLGELLDKAGIISIFGGFNDHQYSERTASGDVKTITLSTGRAGYELFDALKNDNRNAPLSGKSFAEYDYNEKLISTSSVEIVNTNNEFCVSDKGYIYIGFSSTGFVFDIGEEAATKFIEAFLDVSCDHSQGITIG